MIISYFPVIQSFTYTRCHMRSRWGAKFYWMTVSVSTKHWFSVWYNFGIVTIYGNKTSYIQSDKDYSKFCVQQLNQNLEFEALDPKLGWFLSVLRSISWYISMNWLNLDAHLYSPNHHTVRVPRTAWSWDRSNRNDPRFCILFLVLVRSEVFNFCGIEADYKMLTVTFWTLEG